MARATLIGFVLGITLCLSELLYAQQIPLRGVVTVQNSRTKTGQTEYVSEASVVHPNAKPTATDSRGEFTLQVMRLKSGTQTAIEVKPTGKYKDYIVVDSRSISDITLGRTTPLRIYVCEQSDLERRKAELVGINIKKYNEYVDARIAKLKAKPTASDALGKFSLQILNVSRGSQTAISVKPMGRYKNYVVVNEQELRDITLGRLTPVKVYICDKEELERRKNQLLKANIERFNQVHLRKVAELNNRIAELEAQNAYGEERYKRLVDSLTTITQGRSDALQRIRETTESMALINLDDADSVYLRAYRLFEQGELDSVANYLREHIDYEKESKQIQTQLREAEEKKALAQTLSEQAEQQLANAEQAKAQLVKKLLLAAKTSKSLGNIKEAILYYTQLDSLYSNNYDYLKELAELYYQVDDYANAQAYYSKCLMVLKKLSPDWYSRREQVLVYESLAYIYKRQQQYREALESLMAAKELTEQDYPHILGEEYECDFGCALVWDFTFDTPCNVMSRIIEKIGTIYIQIGEYGKAIEYCAYYVQVGLSNFRTNSICYPLNSALDRISKVYFYLGEYIRSKEYYIQLVKLGKLDVKIEDPWGEIPCVEDNIRIEALLQLARIAIRTGEYNEAMRYTQEAIDLDIQTNNKHTIHTKGCAQYLAHALLLQGRYAEAWEHYKTLSTEARDDKQEATYTEDCLKELQVLSIEGLVPKAHLQEVRKVISYLEEK